MKKILLLILSILYLSSYNVYANEFTSVNNSVTNVKIKVLYDKDLEELYGYSSSQVTERINKGYNLLVEAVNNSVGLSFLNFQLIGIEKVDTGTGISGNATDIVLLMINTFDNFLDDIQMYRDGADIVVLVGENTSNCGAANDEKNKYHPFAFVNIGTVDYSSYNGSKFHDCIDNYTFGHEVAHVFGAQHPSNGSPDKPYARGIQHINLTENININGTWYYKDEVNGKGTILSETFTVGSRVNIFSHPVLLGYTGSMESTGCNYNGLNKPNVSCYLGEMSSIVSDFGDDIRISVDIAGPTIITDNMGLNTWIGTISGGEHDYDYSWNIQNFNTNSTTYHHGTLFEVNGNSSMINDPTTYNIITDNESINSSSSKITFSVIDKWGFSSTTSHYVTYYPTSGCGPFGCHKFKNISGSSTPETFSMFNNYPNPFNPSTQLRFDVPEQSDVDLEVFNVMGQRVAMLQQGTISAGSYEITFNANSLPSGLYIARFTALGNSGKQFIREIKMQLVK